MTMKRGKEERLSESLNRLWPLVLGAGLLLPLAADARPPAEGAPLRDYIIELSDPPLAAYDGRLLSVATVAGETRLAPTTPEVTGRRLDPGARAAREYLEYLDGRHAAFQLEASVLLGRQVTALRSYQYAINGVALRLTPAEAQMLADSPMVKSMEADRVHRPQTDAGPPWIGAPFIWNGINDTGATLGEGVVIGVIDSGINWEHPSVADPGPDGYDHINPGGVQLGLCNMPQVPCNDKVKGIYDFVEDNPSTTDVVEENTNGRDNSGHGSHVIAIAAGNRLDVTINDTENVQLSGVAPHANIVSYRVCYVGEPPQPTGGGCLGSAILDAIDQAIADGVHVINYSIGTDAFNPWTGSSIPMAFLNARNADIFIVTSGGNAGPNPGTVGSPANAPWVPSAGNSSHNRLFASIVQNLLGGSTPPPDDIIGASLSGGIGQRDIVHAADFGFPLCGTGTPELQATCGGNQGLSNPWAGNPVFNGKIVVCDRGTYGRVEKGKNVMQAGGAGYILANTGEFGESVVADEHCLPASHIGKVGGDALRAWLNSGSGHRGSITGFTLAHLDLAADQVAATSSRGPVLPPVQDILKPNVIAPGTSILSASDIGEEFLVLTGTSMSSPHIAGAAGLLRALHPTWSVAQIASSIETTATAVLATDQGGAPANPHVRGAGRPRLGEAADAGLYLNVTGTDFNNANPAIGGNPKNLNLFGLVDSACRGACSFTRTVTDQVGGGSWQAAAVGFPAGVGVTIQPGQFNLGNGTSRSLNIGIDMQGSGLVGQWVYGDIRLTASGRPEQRLTVAVYYDGGSLPSEWVVNSNLNGGWTERSLTGLAPMPDATFTSGGLVRPRVTTETLIQDPTAVNPEPENEDPFDGGPGTFTVWHNVPPGALWLHSETLESTSNDLDLFVGRDDNQNGITEESEVLCQSTSPIDLELCDLFTPAPGAYWIIVQNWDTDNQQGDEATLVSAVIDGADSSDLVVSGPGIVAGGAQFDLRLSWSNAGAKPGEQWLGAVGLGTDRDNPNNVGVIPVRFNRNGISAPETLPLMAGGEHRLALAGNSSHDRIYIDIPPGVNTLIISATGAGNDQSNNLSFELYRQNFPAALASPPFVQLPGGINLVGSASGGGGNGPSIAINDAVTPGRYYLKLSNTRSAASTVTLEASVQSDPSNLDPHKGLWNFGREIFQGIEWNSSGNFSTVLWYSYDEDGQPAWYISSGPSPTGNIWVADLLRVTNDGAQQQEKQVGKVSMTFLADNDAVMSYTLFGRSGFEPVYPNQINTCPMISGQLRSYSGLWYRGLAGLGGASVVVYASAQAQVHYFYDALGVPRWLIAADDDNQSATAEVIPLLQFDGFCSVCEPEEVVWDTVGTVTRTFSNQISGSWTLDFELNPPLQQAINRTDNIVKLSDTLGCD